MSEATVIALGFFDGVHLGHGALLRKTAERARELGVTPAAFTFDRSPKEFVTGVPVPLLTSAAERAEIIREYYGIGTVFVEPFDRAMMTMPWEDFITELLVKKYRAVHLVAGHDFRFGYKNQGDPEKLREKCRALGLGCDIIPKVELDGVWYNVDVTWDDAAAIRYDYFNKTDADFASTHVRQNLSVYLPACNGTAYRQENTTGAAGTGQPSEAGGATPDPDAGTTPSGGQTDGSVTDPGQQGDGTQEPEQPGSSLSDYINPDPQELLRYPSGNTAGSAGNTTTAATPEPRADALTDLSSYYEDCRKQLTGLGSGDQHFDNVVPKSLWSTIEQSYHTGAYEQGYVVDVLKNLGMEYFAIQLQLVDIGDGYYRVYHNVVTY